MWGGRGGTPAGAPPSSVPAPDSPCPPAARRGPGGRADPAREQWGAEKGPPAPWGHPLGPPIPYLRTGVSLLSRGARLPLDSLGGGAEEIHQHSPKKPCRHPPVPPLGLIWGGGSQQGTHHVALGSRRAVDAAGTLRGKEGASGRCTPRRRRRESPDGQTRTDRRTLPLTGGPGGPGEPREPMSPRMP